MTNGTTTLLQVVQNDFGYNLSFSLTDITRAPLDISTSIVSFKAQLENDLSVQFNNTMTIINPSQGQCRYTVQAADFAIAGTYNVQIVVTYASEVITFSDIQVIVEAELPLS
jgi:hypothetical protein